MMPDFFWSCTLADNGLSIWTTKKMHPVVVKSCGHRMWSLVVSICDVTSTGGRYYSVAIGVV